MSYGFGPRTQGIYAALRARILSGEFAPGAKLASHTDLATEFGVAPLTVRQVLGRLEEEGFVSLEQGRGTFVRARTPPAVLIVDDDTIARTLLREQVTGAGYRAVEANDPSRGLVALGRDPAIALVLTDVRMPATEDGVRFIRVVRQSWPNLPLAAITGYPDDLEELYGTPECPILILSKPVRAAQLAEILRLTLGKNRGDMAPRLIPAADAIAQIQGKPLPERVPEGMKNPPSRSDER